MTTQDMAAYAAKKKKAKGAALDRTAGKAAARVAQVAMNRAEVSQRQIWNKAAGRKRLPFDGS